MVSHLLVTQLAMVKEPAPVELTVVILTRNRADRCTDVVRHTAERLVGLSARMLVINNGGKPFTLPGTMGGIPCRMITLPRNGGAASRNLALSESGSRFLLMLDDDAYIPTHAIPAILRTLRSAPDVGGVALSIRCGTQEEGCLLPTVFHGCACAFRTDALRAAGGYPSEGLYYGEEYHVAFQLYRLGYRILHASMPEPVDHMRDPSGRNLNRIIRLLVSNNVRLWVNMFPRNAVGHAITDTITRYAAISRKEHVSRGFMEAMACLPLTVINACRQRNPLPANVFNDITLLNPLTSICHQLVANGRPPLVICGIGKFPSLWLECIQRHRIPLLGFLDFNACWRHEFIHNVPIHVPDPTSAIPFLRHYAKDREPACFLTGFASRPETRQWYRCLQTSGLVTWNAENPAVHQTFDMLHGDHFGLFTVPRLTIRDGIVPAEQRLAV